MSLRTPSKRTAKRRLRSWINEKRDVGQHGDLILCELLGKGFSGARVFSCLVNVKILDVRKCCAFSIDSFNNEMDLLYSLPPHPNVIRCTDLQLQSSFDHADLFHEKIGDHLCLFMTKHNCTLQEYLKGLEALPSHEDMCQWAYQIASGIEFLHSRNVMHRDIKAENVFVTLGYDAFNDGQRVQQLVVADFDTAIKKSTTNSSIGSQGFMAPEVLQATAAAAYSFGADVFSFGMLLFELYTGGMQPYEAMLDKPWSISKAVIAGEMPEIPKECLEDLHPSLIELHQCCIATDPDCRPSWNQVKSLLISLGAQENASDEGVFASLVLKDSNSMTTGRGRTDSFVPSTLKPAVQTVCDDEKETTTIIDDTKRQKELPNNEMAEETDRFPMQREPELSLRDRLAANPHTLYQANVGEGLVESGRAVGFLHFLTEGQQKQLSIRMGSPM